jgi:isoleucyl-tRNA synthetase
MRAGLTANEPKSLARWQQQRLYDQVLAGRESAEPFVFHDGPP